MKRLLLLCLLFGISVYAYVRWENQQQEGRIKDLKEQIKTQQKVKAQIPDDNPDPVVEARETQQYPTPTKIDSIMVDKSERKMSVFYQNKRIKVYEVGIGQVPLGHKEFEGDLKTPEGLYYIDGKNPNSDYYKNLGVSYPNAKDRAHAKSIGKSPGGDIKIHGIGDGYPDNQRFGFTWGCISVTNKEMEELYNATPVGIPIHIFP
jgi:murein L,D-transpeptidase YafK